MQMPSSPHLSSSLDVSHSELELAGNVSLPAILAIAAQSSNKSLSRCALVLYSPSNVSPWFHSAAFVGGRCDDDAGSEGGGDGGGGDGGDDGGGGEGGSGDGGGGDGGGGDGGGGDGGGGEGGGDGGGGDGGGGGGYDRRHQQNSHSPSQWGAPTSHGYRMGVPPPGQSPNPPGVRPSEAVLSLLGCE